MLTSFPSFLRALERTTESFAAAAASFANIGGAAVINPDVIMRPRSNSITSQLHQLANLHELVPSYLYSHLYSYL